MSYILFLGFRLAIYQQPPTFRLYCNNNFLDEFTIRTKPNKIINFGYDILSNDFLKLYKQNRSLLDYKGDWNFLPRNFNNFFHKDINWKIFEIDANIFKSKENHNLLLEVRNDDNNFTNGFMTKNTLFSLCLAYCVPKHYLSNLQLLFEEYVSFKLITRKTHLDVSSIKIDYKTRKSGLFDILGFNLLEQTNYQNNQLLTWHPNNNRKKKIVERFSWIGESGHFNLNFSNEILMLTKNTYQKYGLTDQILMGLANKYNLYANQ